MSERQRTSTAITEHVSSTSSFSARPEWIRLPQAGSAEPYTGLKRSKLNELILPSAINGHNPPVKSICLRNKGQKKGVRLISYDSLMAYLNGLIGQQNEAAQ